MNRFTGLLMIALWALTNKVQADENCHLNQLEWLNGQWQMVTKTKTIAEEWKTVSENTMEGMGYTQVAGEEVSSYESLRIVEMSEELFLLAKVAHNAMPTAFKASLCKDNSVVFENPMHDFPNSLHYQLKQQTLVVDVRDTAGKGFKLAFTRLPTSPD